MDQPVSRTFAVTPIALSPVALTAALMLGCTMLVAGTTLLAKALGSGALGEALPGLMVSQARFVFGAFAVVLVLLSRKALGRRAWAPGPAPHWGLHLLRTAFGWMSNVLLFSAAARMALTDANALSFLSPFATMLIAIPLLGERPGPWRWGAAAMAFLGALILLRPGAGVLDPAAFLALGAAITMGCEAIVIKRLAMREPTGRTMLINNVMGAAIASVAALPVFGIPQAPVVWIAGAALGLMMVSAQVLYLTANQRGEASFVAPFWYLTLVWAGVYDALVFDVLPDAISVAGAAVIVTGGLVMTWREARRRRQRLPEAIAGATPAP